MSKRKVLIVEDESIIALSLNIKLQNMGFEVINIIDNGEEAIEIASSSLPDLILMDIRLSGEIDGIQAARTIREKFDIPSIFLTAYVDDQTISDAKMAYPVGYLQKPFDDSDLKASIEVGLFKEEMQKELILNEKKLQLAHEIAKLSHWEWDIESNTGYVSANGLEMLGLDKDFFQPNKFLDQLIKIVHPKDQENFMETFNSKIFKFERFETEFRRFVRGEIKHIYLVAETIEQKNNQLKYVSGVIQDITDMKKTEIELLSKERQLQEAQKLEALGRLAGAIAHDFNNYLTLIMGNLQLLKRSADESMKHYEQFNVLLDTVKYASSLTNQLLTFSKKKVIAPEVIDVNVQILEISELLKILAKGHNFVIHLDALNPNILADSSQFQQILLNLVTNSMDALPYPGTIKIITSNVELNGNHNINLPNGDYLKLQIIDNGVGMDKETMDHAFEPFYTTDPSGKHSGIGLSTVYGITKQFGGEVLLISNEDESGLELQFYFPSYASNSEQVSQKSPTKLNQKEDSKKNILIIEDNEEILTLLETIIGEEGKYNLFIASNGKDGISIFNEQDHIDLIISDILLPGMSGTEIIEEIQGINPDQPFLLISGFIDSIQVQNYLSDTVQFLPKPFMIEEILTKVETYFNISLE